MTSMWETVAAERGALAENLETLTTDQWDTPSLCSGWTVRDVLAHMTSTAHTSPVGFVTGIIRNRGFEAALARGIAEYRGEDGAQTLANFRAIRHSRTAPPAPKITWLGETLVHAEDIRRPLGIAHDYHPGDAAQVADLYTKSNAIIGGKDRIQGLSLRATDHDWSRGEGQQVEGPMMSLLLAISGRPAGCDDLTGEGVATLRSRC